MRCRRFVLLCAVATTMLGTASRGALGQYRSCPPPCRGCQPNSQQMPGQQPMPPGGDRAGQPLPLEDSQPLPVQQPAPTFVAASDQVTASDTFAPNMIGDLLGGASIPVSIDTMYYDNSFYIGSGTSPIVGRVKLSDNNSPLPRDRVFFDYSYFNNTTLAPGGVDVNRFTPGFEKTFFDGMTSIDFRAPMLTTLNSNVGVASNGFVSNDTQGEFGNLNVTFKALLWRDDCLAVAAGVGVNIPTADDLVIYHMPTNAQLLRINNDSVHLTPYVAALVRPNDLFFVQSFLQIDVDTNGNRVEGPFSTASLGRYSDQTYLYLDVATGVWLYTDPCACSGLTGLAGIFEVHYNQSLSNLDSVSGPGVSIGGDSGIGDDNFSLVNLTVGATAIFASGKTATIGYGFPVTGDRVFDGEIRANLNCFF